MCSAKFGMVCFCKFVFRVTLYFDLWYAEGVSKIRKQLDMKRIFFQGYYSIQEEKYNGKQEYKRRFLLWQHHYRICTWQKIYFLAQRNVCTVLKLQAYRDNTIQFRNQFLEMPMKNICISMMLILHYKAWHKQRRLYILGNKFEVNAIYEYWHQWSNQRKQSWTGDIHISVIIPLLKWLYGQ